MDDPTARRTLTFDDNHLLRELVGEFGAHLKMVSRAFELPISQRGSAIHVGPGDHVERAVKVLSELASMVRGGSTIHPTDVEAALRIIERNPEADLVAWFNDTVLVSVSGRPVSPRTSMQRQYVDALRRFPVVFGVGPAGTGKTYLAVAMGIAALQRGDVRRLVLTRPAVEAGEKLGFLPGDLSDKVDPYLRPLFDALHEMLGAEKTEKMLERHIIEIAPLAFMRGRTFNDSFVILDEAQNTTSGQMRMFLTRMGEHSRMVVTGDITQMDLPRGVTSGMIEALDVLSGVARIRAVHFRSADVVRHPLVADIIDAYAATSTRQELRAAHDERVR